MSQESVSAWLRRRRLMLISAFDVAAWGIALAVASVARMDFSVDDVHWQRIGVSWIVVCLVFAGVGRFVELHRGRAPLASLQEMRLLGTVTAVTGSIGFAANLLVFPWLPRSVPLITLFLALVFMAWGRAWWQQAIELGLIAPKADGAVPVVVLGAGDAGRQLLRSMLTTAGAGWRPVALLDDDVRKRHLRLSGVRVRGTSEDIARIAAATGANTIVIAIPAISAARLQAVSQASLDAGLRVKVLPGVAALLGDHVDIRDVRDIDVHDLLGRRIIQTDIAAISSYITGRRVLVTGAGGSIGSELCRQLHAWQPAELIMLDRDESALHGVQLSIHGRALLDSPEVVLADIRDTETIREIFRQRLPEVVFHAAALKHLPMLEQYPGEAVKTNVWGTLAVLEAARDINVLKFVNISTDKAADPVSVLGYSKRLAERLTAQIAQEADGDYLSVRFGNVLGSRGSVLTSFAAQIASGGPVTVTHADMTRFFMTVEEAVQLVVQAAAIGTGGEALVFDMGEPVSIDRVARQLIQLSGGDIDVEYTGLRTGEKLTEVCYAASEDDHRPVHPLISHVRVPPMFAEDARAVNPYMAPSQVIKALDTLCPKDLRGHIAVD